MEASSANTSATGGPLAPISPPPADDLDLDVILQGIVAGLTGLPGDLIRPRWQPTQPRIPDIGTTWCAIGVTLTTPDDTPAQIHHPDSEGYSVLRRFDRLVVLASFYGPRSDGYARLLRDGLYVGQNREALLHHGLNLIGAGAIRRVPTIEATQTRRRSDLPLVLIRRVERRYPILNVLKGVGTINADTSTGGPPVITVQPFAAPRT